MNKVNNFCNPFHYINKNGEDTTVSKKYQNRAKIAAIVGGILTLGLAAAPILYGMAAYYRAKSLIKDDAPKVNSVATEILTPSSIKDSFAAFTTELENEILPLYEAHEQGFDGARIHGRLHVARAVIFSEVMARHYQDKGESVDFDFVRRTTGMHDAGRKGNGPDRWEKESSVLLYNHLKSKNIPKKEAAKKSNIIVKEKANKDAIEFKIFQSADCLDIMRPCTGNGGRAGFKPEYLTFTSDDPSFRENLIEEAWFFIQITEEQKTTEFNESQGFMEKLFDVIRAHPDKLPILSSIL